MKDPSDHLSAIIFLTGMEGPEIVMIPYRNGVVFSNYWLYDS